MDIAAAGSGEMAPYEITILAKKFTAVTREMTQSLLRSARSGVISTARDFSSGITLYDGRTVIIDEGLPVHLANLHLHPKYTLEHFDDIEPGDCFLSNSPYAGNTHHADFTLYAPVFHDGEPLFWVINRAHQADVGAPEPTTYLQHAETIYQEGPHYPAIRVQEDYEEKDDIIRMCKLNIRAGETTWYGDFLGQVSAVRTGEDGITAIIEEYGVEKVKQFIAAWFEYGDQMMAAELEKLPAETFEYTTHHDPIAYNDAAPDGIPINVKVTIDPDEGRVRVDLTENVPNVPAGVNLSEAAVLASVRGSIFCNLSSDIPRNYGSINRIDIEMDEGKVVGKPEYPVGTSCATSNVNDMLFNAVRAAFGALGEPFGFAEGNAAFPPQMGIISGQDFRHDDETYVNQLLFTSGGGGAVYGHDGWITYSVPDACAVVSHDSVEIDEKKYPILVRREALRPDTGGPGKWRGSPSSVIEYTTRENPMTVSFHGTGYEYPPRGILGGESGVAAAVKKRPRDGALEELSSPGVEEIEPGDYIVGHTPGGGGYGDPFERDPDLVREDVEEGYVTVDAARADYGVVLETTGDDVSVDRDATAQLRGAVAGDGQSESDRTAETQPGTGD